MTCTTYVDTIRPASRSKALLYDAALVIGGAFLVALSAQVRILLPVSPVPITGQTLAVLLVGALLGSRRGSLAVVAYLAQGACGLPVFQAGSAGIAYLAGPTGGYLVGFIVAAYVTGRLAERGWDRRPTRALLAMLLGSIALYAFGLVGLIPFVGVRNVLACGLFPFLPGDVLKIALAAALLPTGWKVLGPLAGQARME